MNIGAIFNLQEPGEHAKCGDGVLKESGFHYLPETFFNSKIDLIKMEFITLISFGKI